MTWPNIALGTNCYTLVTNCYTLATNCYTLAFIYLRYFALSHQNLKLLHLPYFRWEPFYRASKITGLAVVDTTYSCTSYPQVA